MPEATLPPSPPLDGILVVDKPAGWTSHDVVARVRRLTGEKRVGHAGTLDPAATGVLPVAVGRATRAIEYLADASKTYLAEVTFGVETDSHDADGVVTAIRPADDVSFERVMAAVAAFAGPQDQLPPMHSAIKVGGKRLYEAARRGETVERATRRVTIHHIELCAWEAPVATILVDCSKGTYIRSLAFDLGRALGAGAYLSDLVRVRTGPFSLHDAWTLADLAEAFADGPGPAWPDVAVHADAIVADWPALVLDGARATDWTIGRAIVDGGTPSGAGRARVYAGETGDWLGIAEHAVAPDGTHLWKPHKVIGAG